MKWAICRCDEGGTVNVQGAEGHSRSFGRGSRVDLDEVVVPARAVAGGSIPAQTMGEALARYLHLFEVEPPVAEAASPAPRGRRHSSHTGSESGE